MTREQEIKEIAYRIWEEEGRPEGRDFDHYLRAEKAWDTLKTETGAAAPAVATTARRTRTTKATTARKTVKKAS